MRKTNVRRVTHARRVMQAAPFSNRRQPCVPADGYGGGGGAGPRGGANRSQGFAGPPQNRKKPGTGIR